MSRCFEKDERHVDAKVKIDKLNFCFLVFRVCSCSCSCSINFNYFYFIFICVVLVCMYVYPRGVYLFI